MAQEWRSHLDPYPGNPLNLLEEAVGAALAVDTKTLSILDAPNTT